MSRVVFEAVTMIYQVSIIFVQPFSGWSLSLHIGGSWSVESWVVMTNGTSAGCHSGCWSLSGTPGSSLSLHSNNGALYFYMLVAAGSKGHLPGFRVSMTGWWVPFKSKDSGVAINKKHIVPALRRFYTVRNIWFLSSDSLIGACEKEWDTTVLL